MGLTPQQYSIYLERELERAALNTLKETADAQIDVMKRGLPSSRVKTRRALGHRIKRQPKGFRANVLLLFAQKYPTRNTTTLRLFRRVWQRTEADIQPRYANKLSANLKGI